MVSIEIHKRIHQSWPTHPRNFTKVHSKIVSIIQGTKSNDLQTEPASVIRFVFVEVKT